MSLKGGSRFFSIDTFGRPDPSPGRTAQDLPLTLPPCTRGADRAPASPADARDREGAARYIRKGRNGEPSLVPRDLSQSINRVTQSIEVPSFPHEST